MVIRELERIEEFEVCIGIQKKAWGFDEIDLVPVPLFVLARDYGGIVLGAFIENHLVGFVYSIPALYNQRLIQHSHMLGVDPDYQNKGIGYKLKIAQKEAALRRGFDLITWTYDFLQAKNSYFNFHKLGCVARKILKDYYGRSTSILHAGLPTDRLLVEWPLKGRPKHITGFRPVLRFEDDKFKRSYAEGPVGIEIPEDIQRLKRENIDLARRWQATSRDILDEYFDRGYQIRDYTSRPRTFLILDYD